MQKTRRTHLFEHKFVDDWLPIRCRINVMTLRPIREGRVGRVHSEVGTRTPIFGFSRPFVPMCKVDAILTNVLFTTSGSPPQYCLLRSLPCALREAGPNGPGPPLESVHIRLNDAAVCSGCSRVCAEGGSDGWLDEVTVTKRK